MYKIYSVFLLCLLAYIYFMAGNKKSDLSTVNREPSNILPFTLIDLGDSCIAPSKVEIDSRAYENKAIIKKEINFSAESKGDQVFVCPIQIAEGEITSAKTKSLLLPNDDYCLYPIKFKEMDMLRCFHEPEPIIRKLEMKTSPFEVGGIPCGPGKRGFLYRFVYEICMTENEIGNEKSIEFCKLEDNSIKYRTEFEIYKFCYDEHAKKVIHTEHKIVSPNLLSMANYKLKQEQEKTYDMMIDKKNYFGLDLETLESKYAELLENQTEQKKVILDQNQISTKPIKIEKPMYDNAQKLVPPFHFSFASWKKPTYHYLNLKPMRKELTKLWNHIDHLIRNDAITRNREYYIHTGAYTKTGDQTNPDTNTKKSLEKVDYWLKIIFFPSKGSRKQSDSVQYKAFAILINNNFDEDFSDTWFNEKCGKNLCEGAFVDSFHLVGKFVRCCSLINGTFKETGIKIDEDLEPDFLYED